MKKFPLKTVLATIFILLLLSGCATKFEQRGYPADDRADIDVNIHNSFPVSHQEESILASLDLSKRTHVVIGTFDFDQAMLTPAMIDKINNEIIDQGATLAFVITTADIVGSHAYNKQLTEARAASVKNYLSQNGLDVSSTKFIGAGKVSVFGSVPAPNRSAIFVLSND